MCLDAKNVTGVVLAGGQSRRMGSDKALLPVGTDRFLSRVGRIMNTVFEQVLISTRYPGHYADFNFPVIADKFPNAGPLAGFHAGLDAASGPGIFVATCDMPMVSKALLQHLLGHCDSERTTFACEANGRTALLGYLPISASPVIQAALSRGERRVSVLLDALDARKVDCGAYARELVNINSPSQYQLLLDEWEFTLDEPSTE